MTPEEIANLQSTMQAVKASMGQPPPLTDIVNSLSGQRPQPQPVNLPPPPNFAPQEIPMGQQMANAFAGALRGLPRGQAPIVAGAPAGVNSQQAAQFQEQITGINQTMLQNRAQKLNEERAVAEQAQQAQQMEMDKKRFEMDNYRTSIDVEKAKRDLSEPSQLEIEDYKMKIQLAVQQGTMDAQEGQWLMEQVGGKMLDESGLSGEALRANINQSNASAAASGRSNRGGTGGTGKAPNWSSHRSLFKDTLANSGVMGDGEPLAALLDDDIRMPQAVDTIAPVLTQAAREWQAYAGGSNADAVVEAGRQLGIPAPVLDSIIKYSTKPAAEPAKAGDKPVEQLKKTDKAPVAPAANPIAPASPDGGGQYGWGPGAAKIGNAASAASGVIGNWFGNLAEASKKVPPR